MSHALPYKFKVMNIQDFEYNADSAAALLRALASKPRLMVLCHLTGGERSVGELAALTGLRMATVSQHLAVLRAERLVRARRDGTTVHYQLFNPTARKLIGTLYRAYCAEASSGRKTARRTKVRTA
jgi:DNA-binding transcriptional ArsR family regulator